MNKQDAVTHQYKRVPLSQITGQKYNPPSRIAKGATADLVNSMGEFGMFYPVLVDEHMNLIDGHRRTDAANLLAWTHIHCLIVKSPYGVGTAYARVNDDVKGITGSQSLEIYLKHGTVPSLNHRNTIEEIEGRFGKYLLTIMKDAKVGPRAYSVACSWVRYYVKTVLKGKATPKDVDTMVKKTLMWIAGVGSGARLEDAMRDKYTPAQEVMDCIDNNVAFVINQPTGKSKLKVV